MALGRVFKETLKNTITTLGLDENNPKTKVAIGKLWIAASSSFHAHTNEVAQLHLMIDDLAEDLLTSQELHRNALESIKSLERILNQKDSEIHLLELAKEDLAVKIN